MGIDFLVAHGWLAALVWAGLYVFDYASTLWLERAARETLGRYFSYEGGIELNPQFEKEIATRKISPRFLYALVFGVAVLWMFGWLPAPRAYEFVLGMLLLTWLFVDGRHFQNYLAVSLLRRRPDSLRGRMEQSYWWMQNTFAASALYFAILFGLLALLTGRIFFAGGLLTCLLLAARHARLGNRSLPSAAPADAEKR